MRASSTAEAPNLKTLGQDPLSSTSPRYGAIDIGGRKMAGFNNIELITDRPLADNLRRSTRSKRFAKNAVITR